MSESPLHDDLGSLDPASILRRLPESEHESFLAEYRAATTSLRGYSEALAEAVNAKQPGVGIDEITALRAAR
jgi:hypothetical protein